MGGENLRDFEAIGWILLNSTEISQHTTRVFHGAVPQTESTLPAINYFLISRPNIADGHGERPRYQISVRTDDPAEAMNIAHEVHSVFNKTQGAFNGFDIQNSYFDSSRLLIESGTTGDYIYHVPTDIFITYINSTST
jgi:hypothetical protein